MFFDVLSAVRGMRLKFYPKWTRYSGKKEFLTLFMDVRDQNISDRTSASNREPNLPQIEITKSNLNLAETFQKHFSSTEKEKQKKHA